MLDFASVIRNDYEHTHIPRRAHDPLLFLYTPFVRFVHIVFM
jgi:hypothetical protein